jgi:hypothetical protein
MNVISEPPREPGNRKTVTRRDVDVRHAFAPHGSRRYNLCSLAKSPNTPRCLLRPRGAIRVAR